jgi:hypothetical protein
MFFSMEKMVGRESEKGVANLKSITEQEQQLYKSSNYVGAPQGLKRRIS